MSISQVNIDAFRAINDLGKEYDFLNPIAIFMAEYMLYILIIGLLVYWFTKTSQNRIMVVQGLLAVAVAEVLGKIAGSLYSHYQPFAELPNVNKLVDKAVDNAFPSDHSIIFFSICFSIWLVRKKEGWGWLILAVLVGTSRIMVGVHYPGDILTSALFGIAAALFSYWLVPKLSFVTVALTKHEKGKLPANGKSEDQSNQF
ncbi:undecaprenyl-diphosphatase [Neobacillus sp. 19]|uniref:undecaprenyl-diphosphatase n=1 Tax=Neobacillus sp. 19 TaxID=3394458 RepID=UPI003BF62395